MPSCKFLLLYLLFIGFATKGTAQSMPLELSGSDTVSLVGDGRISTNKYERDFALAPNGRELFYTLQMPKSGFQTILYSRKNANGKWSEPVVAPFAGQFSDLEPAFSMDGQQLFFVSNRPVTGNDKKDFDIWVVQKQGDEWGQAKNLGSPVNSAVNEFYPAITSSGNIYFTAEYKDQGTKEDIYMCPLNGSSYGNPVRLDSGVNSTMYEFNAYVTPDEQYIIFSSYGRKDDKGGGDLYISKKDSGGNWEPAKNIRLLNSDQLDYCPFLSFDKKTLYFTSEKHEMKQVYEKKPVSYRELVNGFNNCLNGGGNIYKISFEAVLRSLKDSRHE